MSLCGSLALNRHAVSLRGSRQASVYLENVVTVGTRGSSAAIPEAIIQTLQGVGDGKRVCQ